MIVYNTTYNVPVSDARNFVIWVSQQMLPQVEADGVLKEPRLLRILNHHDQDSECFSLQFSVEDTTVLHQWYVRQGSKLVAEMEKLFDKRVLGFSTLMETVLED